MLEQERLIARVRALCHTDERVDAAMMYGSFTYSEGDAYSDIEFLLFFRDDAFDQIEPRAWLEQVAPVLHLYTNDYGIQAVIFDGLVRGEFHFHRTSEVTIGRAWPGVITFPSLESTLIVDKSGALAPILAAIVGPPIERATRATLQFTADQFANQFLFGVNVLRRGEHARALEMLGIVQRALLGMARAVEGTTDHWLTPSRLLERDLSPDAYARFRACTANLDEAALWRAYRAAWVWGGELLDTLHARFGVGIPADLRAGLSRLVAEG